MVKETIIKKIESGKQLGISKKIEKNGKLFWYEYAIQKVKKIYYVYVCEIAEEKMAIDEYEYEYEYKYSSFAEVENNFISKYDIKFSDIKPLKGQYIFSPDLS